MPKESEEFEQITATWREVTSRMHDDQNVLRATHVPGLLPTLNDLNDNLERIQRALEVYLETKRYIFPRFYFVSNDDLLEILGTLENISKISK